MKALIYPVLLLLFVGCSKQTPEPEFYMVATIDGKAWQSNVANSQKTTVAATISNNLVAVLAVQSADNVNTGFGLVFPKTITLNTAVPFDQRNYTTLAYVLSNTEGYVADPQQGGSGTVTVTRFDETAGMVEGTFTGEAVYNQNGSRISIKNGRFRSALYTTPVTTPPTGKR